jgi:LemA protein
MELVIIAVALILIIIVWIIATRNWFLRGKVKIDEANSGIDVALEKRYDLLTKALNIAKGYAKHEKETFSEVIKLRKNMSMEEKVQAYEKLDNMKNNINVLAEAYPQLRSSDIFVSLQKSITDVEEHLQAARRLYNSNVSYFNQKLVSFPSSIIANNMHLQNQPFFTVSEGKQKDVDMSL